MVIEFLFAQITKFYFKNSTNLTFKISQFCVENLLGLFGVVQLGL